MTSQIEKLREVSRIKKSMGLKHNLKQLREDKDIKQKVIARQLGISPNYYSQIENGHRTLQIEHLLKLRDIFKVSLESILRH